MTYLVNPELLETIIKNNSVFASNGYMNTQFDSILKTFRKGNRLVSTDYEFSMSNAHSPFERMLMEFVQELSIDNLSASFGLTLKTDIGNQYPHFRERFNAVSFNLGQGLTTKQKLDNVSGAGFTKDAIAFEDELTSVYKKIDAVLSNYNMEQARMVSTQKNHSWAFDQINKNILNSFGQRDFHAALKAAFIMLVDVYLSVFNDDHNKECGRKALLLSFDYAAAAQDDIWVLNACNNDNFYQNISHFNQFCGPVNHARLQVLLQASQGFFGFSTYVKYFFNALLNNETHFDHKVLLPLQYLMFSMLSVKDRFASNVSNQLFAISVAVLTRFVRILKPTSDIATALETLHQVYGDIGLFSFNSRNHQI